MIKLFLPVIILLATFIGSGELIHACVTNSTGALRIVSNDSQCTADETHIEWGIVGIQGPVGPQGPAGPQGIAGPTGDVGPQGPTGPQGEPSASTGIPGPQGPAGLQGIQGPKGDAGPQGIQGSAGVTGTAGMTGLQGIQGPPGITGTAGITGPQGSPADLTVIRVLVPKTGQRDCYSVAGASIPCAGTGQDGEYELGVTPVVVPASAYTSNPLWLSTDRLEDNGDGTVTDHLTGLIWLNDASCSGLAGVDGTGKANWSTALSAANSLANGTCGLTDGSSAGDWRLPNFNELRSVLDPTQNNPALTVDHPFEGVIVDFYWSSTSADPSSGANSAWVSEPQFPDLIDDNSYVTQNKSISYYVWPVRGGQ